MKKTNKYKSPLLNLKTLDIEHLIIKEVEDYFNDLKDDDYLEFDKHPLSSLEDLMDLSRPAPWDHLTNTLDDEDLDVEIEEDIKE